MFGNSNSDIAEIRSRLTRLEQKVDAILGHLGMDRGPDDLDRELAELVRQGRKLQAVKLYKEKTGASLAAAKAHVEALR